MKEILLTQGQYTLVDDADYDWLNQWGWHAHKKKRSFYAMRQSSRKNGRQHLISMSREILGLEFGDLRQADHINHNTLDNGRVNIRICTFSQNQRNRRPRIDTISQFKGVTWHEQNKKWVAYINLNKRRTNLGCFNNEKEAALAYDMAAIREHGEFACLNFN